MKTLKRWLLYFQMRCVEATIDGRNKSAECVTDAIALCRIEYAQIESRKELRRIRKEYEALRPVRKLKSWRLA